MKIKIIPRKYHEVYFISYKDRKPDKKDIVEFLKAHHPFFETTSVFDYRPVLICKRNFMMITVVHKNYKISLLTSKRLLTASAIIVKSSYSLFNCSIRCPEEKFIVSDNPESIVFNQDTNDIYDGLYKTDTDLINLAKKEKISISLFENKGKKILFLGTICALMFFCASYSFQKSEIKPSAKNETIQTEPEIMYDNFWENFSQEMEAVKISGGIIEEYHYNSNLNPSNTLLVKKSNPDDLVHSLSKTESFSDIKVLDILFNDGIYIFPIQYSRNNRIKNTEEESYNFQSINTFTLFCQSNKLQLLDIRTKGSLRFNIKISGDTLTEFPEILKKYCAIHSVLLSEFHISDSKEPNIFLIEIVFIKGNNTLTDYYPKATLMRSVFNIHTIHRNTPQISNSQRSDELIGKIESDSEHSVCFTKSESGKISINNRSTK